ncbi:MAG: biopolymer transporter ExbD [Planctomycetes bacterium]|nr:biopolymer transporter ExbD [Planctomycetota bacterium]
MAKFRKEGEKEAKADMTPMIDCVFLLIIFFLCIDFKTLEAKLPAYLPKDRGSQTTEAEPIEQLSVKIVCEEFGQEVARRASIGPLRSRNNVKMVGHRVYWLVGPKKVEEMTELMDALKEIAEDPRRRVPDKDTGGTKVMPVVIEPYPQTTYGDVAGTVDAVRAAGFQEINFGGGMGTQQRSVGR